ncbi:MAG: hypothetical protein FP816_11945 [Desulfobacteraceae bacterium]|nr:hypothetical protein [Desulfobacteraceae bacterium]
MDITCENCRSKFRIQEDKIPPDKTVLLNCPKCKNKISVTGKPQSSGEPDIDDSLPNQLEETSDSSSAYDTFDFVEEEGQSALLCELNPELRAIFKDSLVLLEYHTSEAMNIRDALTKIRFRSYDLILVNEKFDQESSVENSVLVYLQRLPMAVRRNIFVVMISDHIRTLDNMAALNKSVNLIIHTKNAKDAGAILKKAVLENDFFFKIYREMQKETGRN